MRISLNFRVRAQRVRKGALSYVGVSLIIIFLVGCSTTERSETKQETARKATIEELHFLPIATSYSCWPCALSSLGRSNLPNEDQQANYFEAGADIPIVAELENDKNQRFYMKPSSVRSKKDLALPATRVLSPSDFTITLSGSEWEKKGTLFMIEGYPHFRWGAKLNPEVIIEGMDDVEIVLRIQYKNGPILTRTLRPNTINTWGLPPKLAHTQPLQLDTSLAYVVNDDGMPAVIEGRKVPSTSRWDRYSQREKPNGYQEKLLGIKADAWNVIEFDFTQGIKHFSGKQCTGVHPARLIVTGQNLDARKQGCQLQIRAQQITGPHSLTVAMVGAPEVNISIPVGIKPMQRDQPLAKEITKVSWGHINNAKGYQDRTRVLPGDRLGYSLKFHDQWYSYQNVEWQKLKFETSEGITIEPGPTTRQWDDPEFYVVIDRDLANALTGALTMEVWYEGRRDLAKSLEYTLDSTSLYSPYLFKANKDTLEKRTGRDGRQGRDGRKGIDGRSAQIQSRANGEHGGDGEAGGDGHNGNSGVRPDPLNLTAMQVKGIDGQDYVLFGFQRGAETEEISLLILGEPWKVKLIGGPGGKGGRGGHGGAGGDGGTGDMNLRGGNGGQGADAGNGGDGGDGADGGDIRLEITDRQLETMFHLITAGGLGGAAGEGGTGGRAGRGGPALMNGRNGKDGRAGRDGSSGYPGRSGQPGRVEVNIANTASKLWSRASAEMRALLVKPAL